MAHSRSARKNIRKNRKSNLDNRGRRAALKTVTKRVLNAVEEKSTVEAQALYKDLQGRLDKTAQNRTIHKNKAARTKSRIQKRINALAKAAAAPKA